MRERGAISSFVQTPNVDVNNEIVVCSGRQSNLPAALSACEQKIPQAVKNKRFLNLIETNANKPT